MFCRRMRSQPIIFIFPNLGQQLRVYVYEYTIHFVDFLFNAISESCFSQIESLQEMYACWDVMFYTIPPSINTTRLSLL